MLFGKHVNKFYKKYFFYFFFGILTLIAVDYIQLFIPELIGNVVDGVNTGTITFTHLDPLIENVLWILLVGVGMFLGRFLWRVCIFGEAIRIQENRSINTKVLQSE